MKSSRIIGCTCFVSVSLLFPSAALAKRSSDSDEVRLSPTARRMASGFESILKGKRTELATILPKIDEAGRKEYLDVSARLAQATARADAAYKEANAKNSKNKQQAQAQYKNATEQAEKIREELKHVASKLLKDVEPFLASDENDDWLLPCAVIATAGPERLVASSQKGRTDETLITEMLQNKTVMRQVLVAGGASHGKFGEAMQIYAQILKTSPRARTGTLQRLAMATALEHAHPVEQRNIESKKGPTHVDPFKRYQHYEAAYLKGELDPGFKNLTTWEMRMVVNSEAPDEILAWGREMLRNYYPDHISTLDQGWRYSRLVKTDVPYGSQDVDKDDPDYHFFQNILANGGVCGRRAFFGRFILRSFGIPVWGVTQKAHAAVGRWTPDGWLVNLGAAYKWSWWEKGEVPMSGTQFLQDTQAREFPDEYMKVLRAKWISAILGEEQYNERMNVAGGFWSSLAQAKTELIAAHANELGPVGEELGEADVTEEIAPLAASEMTTADQEISIAPDGTITVPAVALESSSGSAVIMNSYAGGGQLHLSRNNKNDTTIHYAIDSPKPGRYQLIAKVCTVTREQKLQVSTKAAPQPVEVPLPYTTGMWEPTRPVTITLSGGPNVLTITRPAASGKGITIKEFILKPLR